MKVFKKLSAVLVMVVIAALLIGFRGAKANDSGKGQQDERGKEPSRAICGLSELLKRAAERHTDVFRILMDSYEEKQKKEKQRQEDIELLAEVIYWENWYTDKKKRSAYLTGAVVMNRVNSPKWPNTVREVLYQRGQYTTTRYFFTEELPGEVYDMAADIIDNGTPDVPYNVVYQATFKQGYGDWIDPINGEHFCYGEA